MAARSIVPAETIYRLDPALPVPDRLPTMYDLPSEDPREPGVADEFHIFQPALLRETFRPPEVPRDEIFIGTDINLYYDPTHTLWHKRPDWFAAIGAHRFHRDGVLRYSYVIWDEKVAPFIVIELLSPGSDAEDLGRTVRDVTDPPTKWQVYERLLRVPYYCVYRRGPPALTVFRLTDAGYRAVEAGGTPVWIPELGLGLGTWNGVHADVRMTWVRWFDAEGRVIPSDAEARAAERLGEQRRLAEAHRRTEAERARAEAERTRAETERAKAETERAKAEAERAKAEAERRRAEQAERRLAELEAQLASRTTPRT